MVSGPALAIAFAFAAGVLGAIGLYAGCRVVALLAHEVETLFPRPIV